MESVLISIKPQWCELIASGKKTLEVRKTRPKLEVPFKVYIYCTSGTGKNTFNVPVSHEQLLRHYAETGSMECLNCPIGNGKIIGEFICDAVDEYIYQYCPHPEIGMDYDCGDNWWEIDNEDLKRACLTESEFRMYASGNYEMYGWHISDLKIYEKPKELSEFYIWKKCNSCRKSGYESSSCTYDKDCRVPAVVTRPPQSWCYVEELQSTKTSEIKSI